MKILFLAMQQLFLNKLASFGVTYVRLWNNQLDMLLDGKHETFPFPAIFVEFVSPMEIEQLGNGNQIYEPLFIKIHILADFYDAQDGTMGQNLPVLDLSQAVFKSLQDYMPDTINIGTDTFQVPVGVMVRVRDHQDTNHPNTYHFIQEYKTNFVDSAMNRPVGETKSVPILDYELDVNP